MVTVPLNFLTVSGTQSPSSGYGRLITDSYYKKWQNPLATKERSCYYSFRSLANLDFGACLGFRI